MDKNAVGRTSAPVTMHVERGKIREFARAIKDDNPIYFDEAYARDAAGGIVPPPTFLMTQAHWGEAGRGGIDLGMDLRRVLHGEQEFEYLGPIHPGDVLTAVTRCEKQFDKQGSRGGTMSFAVLATEFRNQRGELVAIGRSTVIETGQTVKS
jgi:acyl dehydratase